MKIHLLSDLHNEFEEYKPDTTYLADHLNADVVVLAGDIDIKCRGVKWAKKHFNCPVLYVPGNHEYYRGHLTRTLEKMRLAGNERVRVLDQDEVVLQIENQSVRFLGVTGWTNFSSTGNIPLAEWDAMENLSDFKKNIRVGSNFRPLHVSDVSKKSKAARAWLQDRLSQPFNGPTVVITHHAPSMRSVVNPDTSNHLDAAYANRWESLMDGVVLWVHGHTHTAVDYVMDQTRVISNPKGYPGETTGFDPKLIVSV